MRSRRPDRPRRAAAPARPGLLRGPPPASRPARSRSRGEERGRHPRRVEPGWHSAAVQMAADELGRLFERVRPHPLELRGVRARGRPDRASEELAVGFGQPDRRELGARALRRRGGEIAEDGVERCACCGSGPPARARRAPPGAGASVGAHAYRPNSRSTSRQIVSVSSTLTAISVSSTNQKRRPARRRARERSIRARRRARSWR